MLEGAFVAGLCISPFLLFLAVGAWISDRM